MMGCIVGDPVLNFTRNPEHRVFTFVRYLSY